MLHIHKEQTTVTSQVSGLPSFHGTISTLEASKNVRDLIGMISVLSTY